jgi:ubiquinone/menaquinone biosynthesis C-methylase UbiE
VRGIIHRHWFKLGIRAFDIYLNQDNYSSKLVQTGYNEVATFYDTYWTEYMSYFSEEMLQRLEPPKRGKCLDLTCGTGFVTQKLSEITSGNVTGVDASERMIAVAQKKYGDTCRFLHDDAYHFLKNQPSNSYDCITCAWGLGYLPPQILYEISRTLSHHGKIGIIDNSLLSNWEFILFFLVALSEEPSALTSYIKPQFYLSTATLVQRMRMNGFKIIDSWKGEKIFPFERKETAMEQLIKSGVAAGIIQLIDDDHKEKIIKRTGELLQRHHSLKGYIPVTHRYIGAVGEKK